MNDNNPKKWNNKWIIIGCAGAILAIVVTLIALDPFTDPVEKIDEQIEQENYSEVVEIYDEEIVETDHEEEYHVAILEIISDTFAAWKSGDLAYEAAKTTLESFVSSTSRVHIPIQALSLSRPF